MTNVIVKREAPNGSWGAREDGGKRRRSPGSAWPAGDLLLGGPRPFRCASWLDLPPLPGRKRADDRVSPRPGRRSGDRAARPQGGRPGRGGRDLVPAHLARGPYTREV